MSKIISSYRGSFGLSTRAANLSGSNSLFGTIGSTRMPVNTRMDFVPADNRGNVIELGEGVNPQWKGLNTPIMQHWAYVYCSPLAAVIDKLAEADTNGKVEFLKLDGSTIENYTKIPSLNRIGKLLNNPNPLQTWEEFNSEQIVIAKIFGYCPVFCIGGGFDKTYTKYMWNLNPYFVKPKFNDKFNYFGNDPDSPLLEMQLTVSEWTISVLGRTYTIDGADILLVKDGYINNVDHFGLPLSKVAGLDFFVSNICAAMEADNVLLKKKGPLGVFSHDPKPDLAGWLPLKKEDKDELQNDLRKYGMTLGQLQYIISKTPLKWNAMSFNVRDLMTKETIRQSIDSICDRFGYPAELMSGKNATYENRNSAEKFMYQNNIIPFSIRRMSRYKKFFGITDYDLVLDYDHLPVLQEDILNAGNAAYAHSQALTLDWQNGIITYNDYRAAKGYDRKDGMDIFYNEYLKKFPPPEQESPAPTDTQKLKKAA